MTTSSKVICSASFLDLRGNGTGTDYAHSIPCRGLERNGRAAQCHKRRMKRHFAIPDAAGACACFCRGRRKGCRCLSPSAMLYQLYDLPGKRLTALAGQILFVIFALFLTGFQHIVSSRELQILQIGQFRGIVLLEGFFAKLGDFGFSGFAVLV